MDHLQVDTIKIIYPIVQYICSYKAINISAAFSDFSDERGFKRKGKTKNRYKSNEIFSDYESLLE